MIEDQSILEHIFLIRCVEYFNHLKLTNSYKANLKYFKETNLSGNPYIDRHKVPLGYLIYLYECNYITIKKIKELLPSIKWSTNKNIAYAKEIQIELPLRRTFGTESIHIFGRYPDFLSEVREFKLSLLV